MFLVLVTGPVPKKNTCGQIDNLKKKFSIRYQTIIEPKMAFVSLLGRSQNYVTNLSI